MASRRCGCASNSCACVVVAGTGITVYGTGTSTDPYIVEAEPAAVRLTSVDEPTTMPGGGVLYVEDGALKYKGSSGTVTELGPA